MKLSQTLMVAALWLAAQGVAAQSLYNETTVQVPLKGPVSGSADAIDVNEGIHFRGEAAAHALADYGVLKVDGATRTWFYMGEGFVQPYYTSTARSKASFTDYLTFAGMPAGTAGTLTFELLVNGTHDTLAAGPWGFGTTGWQLDLRVAGQPFQLYHRETIAVNPTEGTTFTVVDSGGAFSKHRFEVPISFGQAVTVDARMEAWATAHVTVFATDSHFSAAYDLGNSAYWAGIVGVEVGGQPVEFTVSSASGADYLATMVPEPTPSALFLAGILALTVLRRRAR